MDRSIITLGWVIVFSIVAMGVVAFVSDEGSAAQYDIELEYKDEATVKMARGLNPITFDYTVKATGEVLSQEMIIQLLDEPPAWQHFFSATTRAGTSTSTGTLEILMQKGEIANLSLTVTPALNQLNQTYWLKVNAFPKKDQGQNESHRVGVVIPQVAAFEISVWNPPPNGIYQAIPPSTVTIRFALYNMGNGVDRFLVQGESSRSQVGWTLTFVSGIDEFGWTENLTADPTRRNPHFIDVKIPIPAGERADVTCQVTVNATSNFNQSKQMPPAFAQIEALQYFDFQVFIVGDDTKEGTPGEQVEFVLQINNIGNDRDTFTITPFWDKMLNPGFVASVNPGTIGIDPMVNATVQYIVEVPEDAPMSICFFTMEVNSSSPELSPVTKSFAVEVGQHFSIVITCDDNRRETIPGESLEFDVVVRNAGNVQDNVVIDNIEGVPANWLTYTQPPEATLLQGQEVEVSVLVLVPSRAFEAPIGLHKLTVSAHSTVSEGAIGKVVRAECYLEIEIIQFFRIEWMWLGEPITVPESPVAQQGVIRPRRSFNPYERNDIDITMEVCNFGNGNDNITLDGYSPDRRVQVTVTPMFTLLFFEQTKFVKITVQVPEDLPPGVYTLFVNVSSQDPEVPMRVVPLDFEVERYDVKVPTTPTLMTDVGDVVRSELTVDLGADLNFKLKVENEGTKPLEGVVVRAFDAFIGSDGSVVRWNFFNVSLPPIAVGDRYVIGEAPYDPDNPPIHWRAGRTGHHILELMAYYDHEAKIENSISMVNVTVPEDITLERMKAPDNVKEGGNATLTFELTGADDITTVEVLWDDRSHPEDTDYPNKVEATNTDDGNYSVTLDVPSKEGKVYYVVFVRTPIGEYYMEEHSLEVGEESGGIPGPTGVLTSLALGLMASVVVISRRRS